MKLRFSRRAARNLAKIGQDLRAVNPAAASRVEAAIHESLRNLMVFPLMGREQKTSGVRKLVTLRYPYLVYYTLDEAEEVITIISVKHPAQRREHQDA